MLGVDIHMLLFWWVVGSIALGCTWGAINAAVSLWREHRQNNAGQVEAEGFRVYVGVTEDGQRYYWATIKDDHMYYYSA